jgi:hypothetical protein
MKQAKTKASFIEPMLLLRSETLPEGPNWLVEVSSTDTARSPSRPTVRCSFGRETTTISLAGIPPS